MGREYELKYRASAQTLAEICAAYGDFTPIHMETIYYDAPGGLLGQRHWTLRRRMENAVSVCTLKTPLADGSRGEWEVRCADITDSLPLLAAAGAPEELLTLASAGLVPVCGARFDRLAKVLRWEGSLCELALDTGVLLGGGKELPFAEAEVELKEGPEAGADALAALLASRWDLRRETKSKFARARELAAREE